MKGYISIYQITKEKTRKDLWEQQGGRGEIRFGNLRRASLLYRHSAINHIRKYYPADCGQQNHTLSGRDQNVFQLH